MRKCVLGEVKDGVDIRVECGFPLLPATMVRNFAMYLVSGHTHLDP